MWGLAHKSVNKLNVFCSLFLILSIVNHICMKMRCDVWYSERAILNLTLAKVPI